MAPGMTLIPALSSSGFGQVLQQQRIARSQAPPAQAAAPAAGVTPQEKSVRDALTSFVSTSGQKDATKLVGIFTPVAALVDSSGGVIRNLRASPGNSPRPAASLRLTRSWGAGPSSTLAECFDQSMAEGNFCKRTSNANFLCIPDALPSLSRDLYLTPTLCHANQEDPAWL
jgi:hypothetical protein